MRPIKSKWSINARNKPSFWECGSKTKKVILILLNNLKGSKGGRERNWWEVVAGNTAVCVCVCVLAMRKLWLNRFVGIRNTSEEQRATGATWRRKITGRNYINLRREKEIKYFIVCGSDYADTQAHRHTQAYTQAHTIIISCTGTVWKYFEWNQRKWRKKFCFFFFFVYFCG